jgi:hypothetical protein
MFARGYFLAALILLVLVFSVETYHINKTATDATAHVGGSVSIFALVIFLVIQVREYLRFQTMRKTVNYLRSSGSYMAFDQSAFEAGFGRGTCRRYDWGLLMNIHDKGGRLQFDFGVEKIILPPPVMQNGDFVQEVRTLAYHKIAENRNRGMSSDGPVQKTPKTTPPPLPKADGK